MRIPPFLLGALALAPVLVLSEVTAIGLLEQDPKVPGVKGAKFEDIRDVLEEPGAPGRVLFKAKDSSGNWGWYWRDGGETQTIVRTSETVLSGEVKPVEFVGGASLAKKFAVVEVEANGVRALVVFDGETGKSRVGLWADGGVTVPGQPKDAILYLSPQLSLDERDVVFRVARVESPHLKDSLARGDRAICGWFDVDLGDPKACDPAKLITVADWTTEVPGQPGRHFAQFDDVTVDDGLVVFKGTGEGFAGTFRFDARSKDPTVQAVD